jgi:hypothetical protein
MISLMGTVNSQVFLRGPVSELIDSKSESVIWILINFLDLSKVSLENLLSHLKLTLILVLFPMHSNKS